MKKVTTELDTFQCFYPYTVAIVGASTPDCTNFMACAWHTALSFDPPLFGILVAKKRFTHQVITRAGEFTVNFLAWKDIQLSAQLGRISGYNRDKIQEFNVKLSPSRVIRSPILETAYAAMECRLQEVRSFGDHELFVGNVLAIHQVEGSFDDQGVLAPDQIKPLLYLGGDFYVTLSGEHPVHQVPEE